jgi:hypothetical protein
MVVATKQLIAAIPLSATVQFWRTNWLTKKVGTIDESMIGSSNWRAKRGSKSALASSAMNSVWRVPKWRAIKRACSVSSALP